MKVTFDKDEIELTESSVIIRRRNKSSQLAVGVSGDREINLDAITAVELRSGGFLPGCIAFTYPGSRQFRGGWVEASQDPDAFVFRKSENGAMDRFKAELDNVRRRLLDKSTAPSDISASLERLGRLRSEEILSQSDFEQAKAKLLGNRSERASWADENVEPATSTC